MSLRSRLFLGIGATVVVSLVVTVTAERSSRVARSRTPPSARSRVRWS